MTTIDDPYSPTMRVLLDRLQLLYDQAWVAGHRVTEFRLGRAEYVDYYLAVAQREVFPADHGAPIFVGIPVRCGTETTAIIEPRA